MKLNAQIWSLAFAASLLCACGKEIVPETKTEPPVYETGLVVLPEIFKGAQDNTPLTKVSDTSSDIKKDDEVDARDEMRENFIGTLDLFVKKDGESAWFQVYHLKAGENNVAGDPYIVDEGTYEGTSLRNSAEQLLSGDWAEAGYQPGVKYCIYACANNVHTSDTSDPNYPDTPAKLLALRTYESNIIRYYKDAEVGKYDSHMKEKKAFLMDGYLEWEVDAGKTKQVWDISLERAAAKIIVNIKYSDEKLLDLVTEDGKKAIIDGDEVNVEGQGGYTPDKGSIKEYLDLINRVPGPPRWKYVHYAFEGSDVALVPPYYPSLDNEGEGRPLQTYGGNFSVNKVEGDEDKENVESTYQIVCYSYPTSWSARREKAPYILLSIAYTDKDDASSYKLNYYRIPVCNESEVSSLDRNKIYIVDAEIASLGSTNSPLEVQDEELRIEYHVIPWTEENIDQKATTNVIAGDTKYFMVTPTSYILKGDDTQSIDLNWYASVSLLDGRFVDFVDNSLQVTYKNYQGTIVNITGTTSKTTTGGSLDGKTDIVLTSIAPTGTANGEEVTITITPKGVLRVSSEALDSRAVKEISFKVYLRTTGLEETITIRHFPLDNIQSIEGSWSSRWDRGYTTGTVRQYSWNPTADGWDGYDGTEEVEVSSSESYDYTEDFKEAVSDYFETLVGNGILTNLQARTANSESNAVLGSDGYYYWGEGTPENLDGDRYYYDYYTGNSYDRSNCYVYPNRYRKHTVYYRTRYYRDVEANIPTTGSWVDWERDNGKTYNSSNAKYTLGNSFTAKKYNESDGKIYAINVTRSGNTGNRQYTYSIANSQTNYQTYSTGGDYSTTVSSMNGLSNNQMYVIQVTSTSNEYVLGVPVITDSKSQDKVVSPAFMIASQLGATVNFDDGDLAAEHCETYMEVGTDGTRYVGWRLPTEQEIDFILKYQQTSSAAYNKTMAPVLTGYGYWALTGNQAYTTYTSGGEKRVRCVRDLSLEEVNKLNGN